MGLLAVGELPKVTRNSKGRKPGKWKGHEDLAQELRVLASRERDPDKRWGMVAERHTDAKAQNIASAIKKGEAIGFEHTTAGHFEARSRKSRNQSRAPETKSKQPVVLYDVWARYVPSVR